MLGMLVFLVGALAWLVASAHVAPPCRMNQGRVCTQAEVTSPLLSPDLVSGRAVFHNMRQIGHSKHGLSYTWQFPIFFNPAIAVFGNAIHVFIRQNLDHHTAACPPSQLSPHVVCPHTTDAPAALRTVIVHGTLDAALSLQPGLAPIDKDLALHRGHVPFNPEDPRAFTWGDEVWLATNVDAEVPDGSNGTRLDRRMAMQRVLPDAGFSVLLTLDAAADGRSEKNWSPITALDDEHFLFARFVEPHDVLACAKTTGTCKLHSTSSNKPFFDALMQRHGRFIHLATNAVRVSETHFGAVMHLRTLSRGGYMPVPYMFDAAPPFCITHVGRKHIELPSPKGYHRSIIYAPGLMLVQGRLVVSYSVEDRSVNFVALEVEDVFADMEPLPPAGSACL